MGMIVFTAITYIVFKKQAPSTFLLLSMPLDEATRKKRLRFIRSCKVLVLVLLFCLLNGLWQFGKAPVIALLVGVTVNLSMTAGLIYVIVKLQRSLR